MSIFDVFFALEITAHRDEDGNEYTASVRVQDLDKMYPQ